MDSIGTTKQIPVFLAWKGEALADRTPQIGTSCKRTQPLHLLFTTRDPWDAKVAIVVSRLLVAMLITACAICFCHWRRSLPRSANDESR
jgi:hypothetical protein